MFTKYILKCLDHGRVVTANGKHAEAAEQVQVFIAIPVVKILSLGLRIYSVIADGLQNPDHLGVQVGVVQRKILALSGCHQVGKRIGHQ